MNEQRHRMRRRVQRQHVRRVGYLSSLTLVVGLVSCILSAPASAAAPTLRLIALDEARSLALASPLARAARARTAAASAAVAASGAWPASTISAGSNVVSAHFVAAVSLPVPVFGRLSADVAVAEAGRKVARVVQQSVNLDLLRAVTRSWLALAAAQAIEAARAASAARARAVLATAQKRQHAGAGSRFEAVIAVSALARAEAIATTARAAVDVASAQLVVQLGWDPVRLVRCDGLIPDVTLPKLATLRARSDRHPLVRIARRRAAATQARAHVVQTNQRPTLAFNLEVALNDPTLPGNDGRIGLQLAVPLFGHSAALNRAAQARVGAAQAQELAERAAAAGRVVVAWRSLAAALARARIFTRRVLPAAREARELAQRAWRAGQTGMIAAQQADRVLAQIEAEAYQVRAAAAAAFADLEWAAGGAIR